jgi:type I restriction enzyme M protein
MSSKLTLQDLESHLWGAANILRGSIDSSDYKHYIFGLLFLKRINDVFFEEAEQLLEDGEPEDVAYEDPDEHEFMVAKRARWDEIRKHSTDIGAQINKAFAELEEHNPKLAGVLTPIDFNDKERMTDSTLERLLQHFDKYQLRNEDLESPDMLGQAYEYLIAQFADDAGKKGGEFYTPKEVVALLVKLLKPEEGMRVYDPTCGSGGMLIQAAKIVGNPKNISLYGQEKNLNTWAICKMNMLLHQLESSIVRGDTIREPKLLTEGSLMVFDRVIANPPFSLSDWGRPEAENDGFNRFKYGIPPKSYGDLAFVQHMVASCNAGGKVGVVMPHGILFRGSAEGKIRTGLIDDNLLEAVIGLPSGLFYGTGIPACILVLSKAKTTDKVLFIHAADEYEEGKNQNKLREKDLEKIEKAYLGFEDVEKYCRVVNVDEIKKNDYNLNIARYVDTAEEEEEIDIAVALAELRKLEKERDSAETVMNGYLSELGYE